VDSRSRLSLKTPCQFLVPDEENALRKGASRLALRAVRFSARAGDDFSSAASVEHGMRDECEHVRRDRYRNRRRQRDHGHRAVSGHYHANEPSATSLLFSPYFSGGDADDGAGLMTGLRKMTRSAATNGTER
jgi:hypothetical protein